MRSSRPDRWPDSCPREKNILPLVAVHKKSHLALLFIFYSVLLYIRSHNAWHVFSCKYCACWEFLSPYINELDRDKNDVTKAPDKKQSLPNLDVLDERDSWGCWVHCCRASGRCRPRRLRLGRFWAHAAQLSRRPHILQNNRKCHKWTRLNLFSSVRDVTSHNA